jgi:hypothetical protein
MAGLITWYDILGILPGASTEEVRYACEAHIVYGASETQRGS